MANQNRTIEVGADLFDGKGSIGTRLSKLRHLQSLGLVDKKWNFPQIAEQPNALTAIETVALSQARDASKTSGVLIAHSDSDNPRLQTTTYEGDPSVCWEPFKAPGYTATINKEAGIREETVKLKSGERIVIVNADGNEVAQGGNEARKDASEKFQQDDGGAMGSGVTWAN